MSCIFAFRRQACLVAVLLLCAFSQDLSAGTLYTQINLVSDVSGLAAHTDPNLINPWGISFSPTSPFWVSDQGSNFATLYDGEGNVLSLKVSIPSVGVPPAVGPTGQVHNGTTSFNLASGGPAHFLFDTLDGQLLAWNGGKTATNVATTPGAAYTGLAIGSVGSANYLYAADNTGHIDVFDTNFHNVTSTTFAGKFVDPNAVAGFNPFNIQNIGGNLYVTYAATAGPIGLPGGFVDEFDSSGTFLKRIATGGDLYAPWGITLAPAKFGSLSGDLLIGQFGDGEILAYDPNNNDAFVGTLNGKGGKPIVNPFLWALEFRTGGKNVNVDALYFTAGYNNQKDGLFGEIATPEPGTMTLLLAAMGSFGARHLLRSKKRMS